jgi:hypothetical protein
MGKRVWSTFLLLGALLTGAWSQALFPVKIDRKWGLIDQEGRIVLAARYDAIGEFKHYGMAIMQRDGGVGLLNAQAREVIPPRYQDLRMIDSGLVEVMVRDQWQVINLDGRLLLPSGYEEVRSLGGGLISFRRDGLWGLVDDSGRRLTAPEYEQLELLPSGHLLCSRNRKQGLLSTSGKVILPPLADELRLYGDQTLLFRQNGRWGIQDMSGKTIAPASYRGVSRISDHFLQLQQNEERVLYAIGCKRLVEDAAAADFLPFEGQEVLMRRGKYLGLLDGCGRRLLPAQYEDIQVFTRDLYRVKLDGRWGIANRLNQLELPLDYNYIAPPRGRFALIKRQGRYGLINHYGQEVVPPVYARVEWTDRQAKAFRHTDSLDGHSVILYTFDEQGLPVEDAQFNRHFSISIQGAAAERRGPAARRMSRFQLPEFEWFFDPVKERWGLRRLADGAVQIEPVFSSVEPLPEIGLTLVGMYTDTKLQFERTAYRFSQRFGLVDNRLGALVTEINLLDVRLEDFLNGMPAAGCLLSNGRYGLLHRSGRMLQEDLAYLGTFEDGLARVSPAGRISAALEPAGHLGPLRLFRSSLLAQSELVSYTDYDREFDQTALVTCEDCSWGYMDTLGRLVVPARYDFARPFEQEVGIVQKRGKWGMIDRSGKILIRCAYDDVHFLEHSGQNMVRVYVHQPKYGLIDSEGRLAIRTIFDDIGTFSEGRLAVKRNGLWGYVDRSGLEVIPCRFKEARPFHQGRAAVRVGNNWGFIDKQGEEVLPIQYSRLGDFSQGLAWVYTRQGVGYVDWYGQFVIQPQYERGYDFRYEITRVMTGNRFGLINTAGDWLCKPRYIHISGFNEHRLAIVEYGSDRIRKGLLNLRGELITLQGYQDIEPFSEGLAAVKVKASYGYIDTTGQLVIPPRFSKVSPFSEGLAAVQRDGLCGYINPRGEEVVDFAFSRCESFDDGTAVVYQGIRRSGLVDQEGNLVLEPGINRLLRFREDRGLVRDPSYRFFYITDCATVYDGYYDQASPFRNGVAVVQVDGKWGVINQKGIEVIPPKYDRIGDFENGFAKMRVRGFNGLSNLKGELLIRPDYEYIGYAGNGIYRVEQGDQVGYFDAEGKWVWRIEE